VFLYDTESKTKREFQPSNPENVTMYVCGPTVYSYAHIGNARPAVVFDILARVLRTQFKGVTYARNITDIDDNINAAAAKAGVGIDVISERFTQAYHADLEALGVLPTDVEPKVTDHIDEIHQMIESLIVQGYAYAAKGHVLFSVESYKDYGALSKRDPEELLAGARVDVAAYKRSAGDFVLWKPSGEDQPGWDSPWGRGRPGWHIECSAMSAKHLGETIDIHGGGHDLVFPHHENERAQSACAHGVQYVRFWLHNGFVNVNHEKMSKSIGNVLLVKDLLKQARGEAIRYVLMAAHYRAPLDWSDDVLQQAESSLDRLYGALRQLGNVEIKRTTDAERDALIPAGFKNAMLDDLNTPMALAELFSLSKQANTATDIEHKRSLKASMLACGSWLGILQQDPEHWFQGVTHANDVDASKIEQMIESRNTAKASKDWSVADRIRDELTAMGVVLEDSAQGTKWKLDR